MRGSLLLILAVSLAVSGCATPGPGSPAPPADLRQTIDRILDRPPLDQMHWGVLAVAGDGSDTLYARNPARKFVPASNMKVVSTTAALGLLGPEYRYRTELWAVGSVDRSDGVLDGNLVLPGTGDPTLSDRFRASDTAGLTSLADSVRAAGVRRVAGGLIVDASRWDSTSVRGTWMVEDLPWSWAATGGAFAVGEGEITVEVAAGSEPGLPPRIRWWPAADTGFVTSRLRTVEPDGPRRIDPAFLPETGRVVLRGTVPAGSVDTLRIAARRPVRLAAGLLLEALEERGVTVDGGVRVVWSPLEPVGGACLSSWLRDCSAARRLASLSSPSLLEVARGILEPSQNWMAEQLLRTLGLELGPAGSWTEGIELVGAYHRRVVGVDSLDLVVRDGSGLSAYNLVTPRAMVRILEAAGRSSWGRAYRDALAEPGEVGTLETRLAGLEGRVHAKTGTITHVNSLSGYLVRTDGREVVFSILSNGSGLPSSTVRAAIDRVVRVLAGEPTEESARRPSVPATDPGPAGDG